MSTPHHRCLHELVAAQAARTPRAVAVAFAGSSLTYRELDRAANRLAHRLRRLGAGPEAIVAVALERSLELPVALLAALKAGAAYLPLDPGYPRERLAFMLEESRAAVLLTTERLLPALPAAGGVPVLCLDREERALAAEPDAEPAPLAVAGNLAYVLYTSGSTGRPKGVAVPHAAIVNHMLWLARRFVLGPADRVLQKTPFSFDASVWEFYAPWLAGGTLVVARPGGHQDAAYLVETLRRQRITILQVVPSLLRLLAEQPGIEECRSLRLLFCGGEPLPRDLVERFRARLPVAVYNLYGPTEATIDATCGACAPGEGATVPLGEPIDGVRLVRTETLWRRAPAGGPGELLIGGAGLARGYLGRPGLTAERFVPDAFSGEAGARLYRTGDLARKLPGGGLEFAGRRDHQVKVRGFRIELGEIEAALAAHPAVREAVVVAQEEGAGETKLVAYVVLDDRVGAESSFRAHLARRLPDYMVPNAFVLLPKLPLSPNGKVDRAALPAPADLRAPERPYLPPRTETEERLAAIWGPLLGVPQVGAGDDFLELGGHSLAATQMISRVRDAWRVELALATVFERPTLAELAAEIDRRAGAGATAAEAIVALPRGADFPLSFSQERIWFLEQLDPSIRAYQFQTMLRLQGRLDVPALAAALAGLVRRHEIFRTTFPEAHGRPVQHLHPAWEPPLPVVDLAALPAARRAAEIERRVWEATQQPFDLARLPLVRWTLLRAAPEEHLWVHVEHHLLHDGWSLNLLLEELAVSYGAHAAGRVPALAAPAVQLADFAAWQRRWAQGPEAARQLAFWTRTLAGRTRPLDLPADRPRPPRQSFRGRVLRTELPAPLADALRAASRGRGVSLFMTLEAAFAALCARLADEEQPNVGSAVACRRRPETERMIGMIVNNVVLAHDLAGDPTVAEHLARTRRLCLDADAHQDVPFDHVVQAVRPPRDLSRNPLFQVSFSFHDSPLAELVFPGLRAELIEGVSNGSAKFDLNVICIPRREQRRGRPGAAEAGITVLWEHATDLFETATVERMAERWQALLQAFAETPQPRLSELPLLTAEERRQVAAWSRGAPPRPAAPLAAEAPRSVQELVAARAAAAPEAPAVAGGGVSLTYGELEAQANRLARCLKKLGVREESRVAVCLERSPELVVAILGVLKAGGAYLPLDPAHPPERLAFTLADARPAALLTSRGLLARLAGAGDVPVLALDDAELAARLARESPAPFAHPAISEALAYVIYTSGSTGTPKGTELTHRGLLNLIGWHLGDFALTLSDRTTLIASPAFDASVWEVWPALAAGASLHVPPDEVRSSPPDLLAWLAAEGITVSFLPTPLAEACLAELEESAPPDGLALRVLLTGGDRLHRAPRAGLPFRLVNCYGPTESTVVATAGTVPPRDEVPGADGPPSPPAIGRPIAGLEACVLDAHLRPAPAGVPGELYVGGLGLARGYLQRPDLTAERFVPHPLAGAGGDGDAAGVEAGARLYRTGDLVRWRADGAGGAELEFLGRGDQQVKVRGVRIELAEVEAALAAHPAVRDAVVAARPSPGGEDRLVAYLVPHAPGAAGPLPRALAEELRAHLAAKLPEAMLPAAWVALEALPLTAAGKVDRRALPEPAWEAAAPAGGAPSGLAEELLAAIWGQVLGTAAARREDSFFALGGHSLLATQVMSRVRSAFHVELPLRTLFERPTLAELAAAVAEELNAKAPAAPPALVPGPLTEDPPLSFAQERLWFLDSYGGGAVYTVPEAWRLDGALDPAALAAALSALVRRHETLRTTFAAGAHGVRQVVGAPRRLPLPVADLSGLPEAVRSAEAERLAAAEARRPFDLAAGPLLRAVLLRLAPARHEFLLALHHIATDGWSQALVHRELGSLYAAAREHRPHALPPLPVQYRDFARWQRDWLQGEALAAQLGFWRAALAGAPPLLALPTDRPRPAVQTFRGDDVRLTLPASLVAELEALSRRQGVTLFMTLLAAFDLLLAHRAAREDIVVGTPIAGRNQEEVEGLVGFFVNTLALRTEVGAGATFAELLAAVRDGALAAFAHQELPFEKLVEELAPRRDLSHPPLFQVLFALHQFGAGAGQAGLALPGVAVRRLRVEQRIAKFDLALHVEPGSDGLAALARYNTDLFDAATVHRFLAHFRNLLAAAAARPEARLDELAMLAPTEAQQLLREWNDTAAPFPADLCLHEPFEAQARARPEALAVVSPRGALTYGELDRRAARLARRLAAAGVGPGDLVGVHLDRSPAMAVAVVGVLKAGAAYVPLESGWPAERIDWIVAAHGIAHLVTEPARRPSLGPAAAAVVCLDEPAAEPDGAEAAPLPRRAGPEDLAYIIFTSGSTGTPKGVMVRHAAAVNLVHWVNRRFAVGPEDRLLFVTALSFDLSVYDLFGTLAAGGTVRLATSEDVRDPQRLVRILREEGITFWDSAPAMLQSCEGWFGDERTPSLRLVFNSGDWIPVTLPDRVRAAFPNAEFVSLGGATEATVWSNFYPVREVDPAWTSIPYGRPIANALYHVLDPALAPCPIGVPGDLYIGGPCLSLGYAADPAQTAAKYLPSPWGPKPGARLYQTGDRARWLADGNLEFLGRRDTQVKVRGFRIELGEIETVLTAHPWVREAVVLAHEASAGDRRLVAYFVPEGGSAPDAAALRRHLQAKLPDYMLPAAFVPLAAWPLSPTGKLDRKALPPPFAAPPPPRVVPAAAAATPAAPAAHRGEVARGLAALWREVIGIEEVGPDDNFFELGGHSLLLARVHARLPELVGRTVPMIDLFKHPTVASLAAHLAAGDGAAAAPAAAAGPRAAPAADGRIAVVGMAGRFPGARDVEELWANLRAGVESIRFFADDELLAAGVPAAQLADPRYVRARGMLGGTDLFDAPFFDVTPREAQALDPQQRLFLECAWQALEDAGHAGPADSAADLRVGVYAGASENGYLHLLLASPTVLRAVGRYGASLANNPDYLATRVSYKLDLQGPSLSVQTACSTSLVAVHLACRSLLAGDCDLALAGGVSVRVPEVEGYLYEEGGIASPDGHTRPFDAAATGTVRSSGAGVVALKRLADALADGDAIHAVVLGSAVNNDGARKVGFTAPAVRGQAAVVREAQRRAGVAPETITMVEAHGTATALGDPIELTALTEAFRAGTDRAGFCALGSVKSNLGHTDAAAGVAGLLKTVLALEHRELPPSLHFREPNPKLGLEGSPFYVVSALAPWEPPAGTPRRAGVSSFGIGGTNAHLVLEEAPAPEPGPRPSRAAQLLLLSAKTPAALEEATVRLAARLDRAGGRGDEELADAAFTLQVGRKAMGHRRAVVCRGAAGAAAALRGAEPWRLATGACIGDVTPVCFLLPGQGVQHVGMGEELYAAEPVFRDALDRCCELLAPELGLDLRALLYPPAEADREEAARRLEQTALAQPALFAVETALAELWASWGVRPRALLGHSLGEYVAAHLAGVVSLADGLRLVAARGRLMQALPAGAMLAVPLGEEEVTGILGKEERGELSLAAVNAPSACVVSGPADAIDAFAARLAKRQVAARRLHTSHAFHSAMMEPAVEAFRAVVETVPLSPPALPYLSNVTGTWITAGEATDPGYWARHLRETVRCGDGLATLLSGDPALLLEVGPGQTLSTFARRQPGVAADRVVPSLPRAKDRRAELDAVLGALGRLWIGGAEIDWRGFWAGQCRRRVPLPTYPFERRRYWVEDTAAEPAPLLAVEAADSGNGHAHLPGSELEEGIAGVWRDLLGVARVGVHDDFFDLGGSSLLGLQLASRLRRALGLEVSSDLLLEAPTVAAMAALLAARLPGNGGGTAAPGPAPSCLVRLQAGAGGAPLFLVHQVGGHVYTFRALARELPREQPVYGLRSLGLEAGEEPLDSIAAMAAHYLELVRGAQPRGPYLVGGASMGGMVAFEMARRLGAAGEEVALLALMDTPCLDQMPAREGHAESVAAVFRGRVDLDLEALRRLEPEAQLALALETARREGRLGEDFDPNQARRQVRVIEANAAALYAYAPERWEGRLLFFRAEERRPGDPPRPELPWIELARGGAEVVIAPGNHLTMHEPPHVATLARHLRRALGLGRDVRQVSSPALLQPRVAHLDEEGAVALS